jgi:hypothetical protein
MNRYLFLVVLACFAPFAAADVVCAQGLYTSGAYGIHIGGFRPQQINTGGFATGGIRSTFVGVPNVYGGGIHTTVVGQGFTPAVSTNIYTRPMLGGLASVAVPQVAPAAVPQVTPAVTNVRLPSDLGLPFLLRRAAPVRSNVPQVSPRLEVGPAAPVPVTGGVPQLSPPQFAAVRTSADARSVFTPAWFRAHPTAWSRADLPARARQGISFDEAVRRLGVSGAPFSYDYGGRMNILNGSVYYDGQPVASADEYIANAVALAAAGSARDEKAEGWHSLGGFALVPDGQTNPSTYFQLAVNEDGMIRGTAYNVAQDKVQPLTGSLNKKYQRAAWMLGGDTPQVFDSGLYNLTRESTPVFVYSGNNKERETLVRLE